MIIDARTVRHRDGDAAVESNTMGTKVVSRDKNEFGTVSPKTLATCLAQPHVMMTIFGRAPKIEIQSFQV